MRWSVEPRFGYGTEKTRIGARRRPCRDAGADALAVRCWGAGSHGLRPSIGGQFSLPSGRAPCSR